MERADRIRSALSYLPVGDNNERWRIAAMIYSEVGESGRVLWDEWRKGRGDDDAESTWRSASKDGRLKIGTLYYEAEKNDWPNPREWLPDDEWQALQKAKKDRSREEDCKALQEKVNAAKNAEAVWKAATEAMPDFPYLVRKRVSPVKTLREIEADAVAKILGHAPLTGRLLVVPVKVNNALSSLELIDADGGKRFLKRGAVKGGYWASERLPDGDGTGLALLIGEGVATVLSAKEATGHPAIAALSSGNLPAVAKAMRERYPAAELVVLADLVKATGDPDPHAIEAAQAVSGKLAVPHFGPERTPEQTDFNDMAMTCGKEAVGSAIANATAYGNG